MYLLRRKSTRNQLRQNQLKKPLSRRTRLQLRRSQKPQKKNLQKR